MSETTISVARDFSRHPGPRKNSQGKNSGERFRELLKQKLKKFDVVNVDLDGTSGIGSSFLDETFGGLIRYEGFTAEEIERRLKVKSELDETYLVTVRNAILKAQQPNGDSASGGGGGR